MHGVNIHEAETQLSHLVEWAAQGEAFIIAKAGKPMVKVVPLDDSARAGTRRIGFPAGQITVPEGFDRMAAPETEALCAGGV
jgi:prevent-host-death family protein